MDAFETWWSDPTHAYSVDFPSDRLFAQNCFLAGMEAQKQRDLKFATLEAECADMSTA